MLLPHSRDTAARPARRIRPRPAGAAAVGAASVLVLTAMTGSAGAIVNGDRSTERYPFMATVPMSVYDAQCGASLIHPQWLLTAGHCVERTMMTGKVRVGSENRKHGGTVREVDKIIRHPGYSAGGGHRSQDDIALIRMDRPVGQRPIAIAKKPGGAGTPTRLLGFGTVHDTPEAERWVFPDRLQQLDARRAAASECSGIGAKELCTTSPRARAMACNGDSGGPQLQRNGAGRWELIGATSGDGDTDPLCASGKGIYTDVTAYKGWISRNIARNS
ncbi:S1 family peptidase [Streptomyces sp. NPDC001889]